MALLKTSRVYLVAVAAITAKRGFPCVALLALGT